MNINKKKDFKICEKKTRKPEATTPNFGVSPHGGPVASQTFRASRDPADDSSGVNNRNSLLITERCENDDRLQTSAGLSLLIFQLQHFRTHSLILRGTIPAQRFEEGGFIDISDYSGLIDSGFWPTLEVFLTE